jgi:dTDP-4-amino-4,6-dideoxygalactose transaminase
LSDWEVPLSDFSFDSDEIEAVTNVLRSGWLTMSDVTMSFEQAFAQQIGVKYACAVSNGTAALHIAHSLFDLKQGDEVITTALTFVATANSILYAGATPVFADIRDLHDLTIDPDDIERKITPRTKGITVVHYGGNPCDMTRIAEIAREHGLFLIEDSAHAPGGWYDGRACGTWGDVGCFSFFSNKNLVTGEGGMIVTNNPQLAKRIPLLRSHGMTSLTMDRHKGHNFSYDVVELGYNYRIDEMRSALGLVQLRKLHESNLKRRRIDGLYRAMLQGRRGLVVPFFEDEGRTCHIFPTILDTGIDRKDFMSWMRENGIQTSIHYPPIHRFDYYERRFPGIGGDLHWTEEAGRREVSLPMYPEMSNRDVEYVAGKAIEYLGKT